MKSDPDVIMADGDMVKIDLGCHLDGFIAVVAHTLVIGASADNPVHFVINLKTRTDVSRKNISHGCHSKSESKRVM